MSHVVLLAVVASLLLGMPGCQPGEPMGKVFGTVTNGTQPLQAGLVIFDNNERGIHIMAAITSEGRYQLHTAKGIGLPLGQYRVSVCPPIIEPVMPGAPKPPPGPRIRIPDKFLRPETSGLTVAVHEGENRFDISME